ncbi:hypothetical protein GQ43DRAFT_456939 [Delitschia confertaspora ATCC 74209]|uniref:C2H2-type domain-containing protein n=1 Tax=Delitschia confertaspora ATCC 74209 TaxID=1513339 RepID=A0A9P4MXB2_9PLEO|nr:hypothetical protein GQ43DRAFT_456939 [Delitschia confertaspora ATCC 74209]
MAAKLQPVKAIKCTYNDCAMSFDTVLEMKRHKKYAKEHDYCPKCDEDFDSWDELTLHKAFRPDNHGKACRLCGEEFRSESGMVRHVKMSHKMDQKVPCIGCGAQFYRASLLVEHLEFGHCDEIPPQVFHGCIVHKFLVHRLLQNVNGERDRFYHKISKHDKAYEEEQEQEEGGISLELGPMDDDEACHNIEYEAIQPEVLESAINPPKVLEKQWPDLPSRKKDEADAAGKLASALNGVSLHGKATSVTISQNFKAKHGGPANAWKEGENAGKVSKVLFPNAKPTPRDDFVERESSSEVNIFKTRFWDPTSAAFKADRFYEPASGQYYCPHVCEQTFTTPADLTGHILSEHRITIMRCPRCLKVYKTATALIGHCESGSGRCRINECEDYAEFLDRLSGGFLYATEETRPDHLFNPEVMVPNEHGRLEPYSPPTVEYIRYEATKPTDWTEQPKKLRVGQHV